MAYTGPRFVLLARNLAQSVKMHVPGASLGSCVKIAVMTWSHMKWGNLLPGLLRNFCVVALDEDHSSETVCLNAPNGLALPASPRQQRWNFRNIKFVPCARQISTATFYVMKRWVLFSQPSFMARKRQVLRYSE